MLHAVSDRKTRLNKNYTISSDIPFSDLLFRLELTFSFDFTESYNKRTLANGQDGID